MSGIELKQADNGFWYVHWTEGRRSKRVSTRRKDLASAKGFLATWLRGEVPSKSEEVSKTSFELRRGNSGNFYLHYREGRRTKRVSTRQKHLPGAKAFLVAWLTIEVRAAPTCGDLWALYHRDHVARECATDATHFFAWKQLEHRFASLRPAEVTREIVARHRAARAPAKCFVELRLLTASWNYGKKRRWIAEEDIPCIDDLDLPKHPPPRTRWLSRDEKERLFAAAERMRGSDRLSRVERFMHLALETAGRRNALLELSWAQVDFEIRVIHLNPEGRAQTRKRRASVPISDTLLAVLQRAYDERISNLVLDHSGRLHWQLDKVAEAAGVPDVTAHVFRHTHASWLARDGETIWKISKILGTTVEEVEKTYAKHCPSDLIDSVNRISSPRRQALLAPSIRVKDQVWIEGGTRLGLKVEVIKPDGTVWRFAVNVPTDDNS